MTEKENYLYHWTNQKGFEYIKKYGINGEEGWLYTLLNNETGGLQEYTMSRMKKGESAYGIRTNLSQVIQDDSNYCYMDHNTRIGHPFDDLCRYVEGMCNIDRCKSDCDMEKEYKGHENYYGYLDKKFDECGKKREWWTKEKVKYLHDDYLEKLFTLKGQYGCHIKPKDLEYAEIKDPYKEIPQKLKYKKVI